MPTAEEFFSLEKESSLLCRVNSERLASMQPLKDGTQNSVSIFYKSDWDPAVLHYCHVTMPGWEDGGWRDVQFEVCEKSDLFYPREKRENYLCIS